MNTIVTILNSLKVDQTFLIQFVLFIVFFNIIAPVLFKRLQAVLDLRESKTTKLDSHANHVYKQADDLAVQYKASIEKTHSDSQSVATKKKSDIQAIEKAVFHDAEEKMTNEYEGKRTSLLRDIAAKRTTVLAEADELSKTLVEKLTK